MAVVVGAAVLTESKQGLAPLTPWDDYVPAGRGYLQLLLSRGGASAAINKGPSADEVAKEKAKEKERWMKIRDRHTPLDDYYGLLGLEDRDFVVSEEEVRAAHRAASMYCHPDKAPAKERSRYEDRFKAIQSAFETLSDSSRKLLYDSSVPIDENIPDDDEGKGADFFPTYGPVFRRFAKYSIQKPVPDLGDANTPFKQVDDFYDFWFSFKSWRDFGFRAKHNLNEASGRDEKRWMQKENAKTAKQEKKTWAALLSRLTDDAFKKDPRVLQRKAETEAERKAKKQEKKDERLRQEQVKKALEEKAQMEEETRKQQEAEALAQEKQEAQNLKKKLKHVRKQVRELCAQVGLEEAEDVKQVTDNSTLEELTALAASLSPKKGDVSQGQHAASARTKFAEALKVVQEREEQKRQEMAEKVAHEKFLKMKKLEEAKVKQSGVWSLDEMSALAKAVAKFPGAVPNRWEKIAAMINALVPGSDRNAKEVITKVKEWQLEQQKMGKEEAWARYQQKNASLIAAVESGTLASASDETVYKEAPKGVTSASTARLVTEGAAAKPVADKKAGKKKGEKKGADKAKAGAAKEGGKKASEGGKKAAEGGKKAAAVAEQAADPLFWSAEQQSAFEAALKTVPKDVPDRWGAIADKVQGKSKADCVNRFKEIRAKIMAQRQAKA
eukprot:g67875.t1